MIKVLSKKVLGPMCEGYLCQDQTTGNTAFLVSGELAQFINAGQVSNAQMQMTPFGYTITINNGTGVKGTNRRVQTKLRNGYKNRQENPFETCGLRFGSSYSTGQTYRGNSKTNSRGTKGNVANSQSAFNLKPDRTVKTRLKLQSDYELAWAQGMTIQLYVSGIIKISTGTILGYQLVNLSVNSSVAEGNTYVVTKEQMRHLLSQGLCTNAFIEGTSGIRVRDRVPSIIFHEGNRTAKVIIYTGAEKVFPKQFQRYSSMINEVEIQSGISNLSGALAGLGRIQELRLPDSITCLNDGEFAGCRMLKNVRLSDNLQSVGGNIFDSGLKVKVAFKKNSVTGKAVQAGTIKIENCTIKYI